MNLLVKKILISAIMLIFSVMVLAQTPPHPNGGKTPGAAGTTNAPVGGGAPIGNGIFLLIVLASVYGGWKLYHYKPLNNPHQEIIK